MADPLTTDDVAKHLAYLALIAKNHDTLELAKFVAEGTAPCFMCAEVCPFKTMLHTSTGRSFCDHLCLHGYAS